MSARAADAKKFSVAVKINWTILSLGLVVLALLLRLGFWQLERAEEKQRLLTHVQQQQSQPALALETAWRSGVVADADENPVAAWKYRKVTLRGQFDAERYWLLDNQVQGGVVGYHVIGLLIGTDGLPVLVNRGWVPAPLYREQLPPVSFPAGTVTVAGRLMTPAVNPLMRVEPPTTTRVVNWPLRVQQLSVDDASAAVGQRLFPALVQLQPDDAAALVMEWRDVNVSVSKHHGYAVQWFAMAAALIVALLLANTNHAARFTGARDTRDKHNKTTDTGAGS